MRSLFIRAISGLIVVILTFFVLITGGRNLSFFTFLLSVIGLNEFYNAISNKGIKPIKIVGFISCIGFLLNSLGVEWATLLLIFIFGIIGLLLSWILRKETHLIDIIVTFFSIFYIPFLIQHIIYLDDTIFIWLIFIFAWGTDTFAYLSGSLFGKHKLCPKLSPKKTIEGSIGGILGAGIITFLYARYFNLSPVVTFILISVFGSIISQIGDLVASKIKRITGIKDFGFIMPGHGGILDRFDSILFTAPYVYYVVKYLL